MGRTGQGPAERPILTYRCAMRWPCGSTLNYKMGRTGQGPAERPILSYRCAMR